MRAIVFERATGATLAAWVAVAACAAEPDSGTRAAAARAEAARAGLSFEPDDAALLDASATPAEAVDTAERTSGGEAVALVMGRDQGVLRYAVQTVTGERSVLVLVDTAIGNPNRVVEQGPVDAAFQGANLAAVRAIVRHDSDLMAAVASAQRRFGGTVIAAAPTLHHGHAAFRIRLLDRDRLIAAKAPAMPE